jgi:hypothetical protein
MSSFRSVAQSFVYGVALGVFVVGALWGARPVTVQAQDQDSTLHRVETTDGNVFIGTLVTEDDQEVVLTTERLGTITIARADIRRMRAIEPDRLRDGEYWFANPQSTRYFFAPNAIGLPAGGGYYQNTWIFLNNVNVGVTRNFSMGAGTVPVFLLGASALPFWLLPKVSVSTPADNVHLAAGAVLGGILGADGEGAGLVYGVTTLGSRDANLSIGLGYGYAGSEWSSTPALTLSGMARVGRTTYLITENYAFPGSDVAGIISFGFRWAPEHFAVDFGLVRPLDVEEGFIGVPWLGVTIPFGR